VNPYAAFLGTRDPRQVIADTSARLHQLINTIGEARADEAPAPQKWSAREILCHLADCEIVFAFRLRQTLAEPHHIIQPFDQDLWATNYNGYDVQSALAVFTAVRNFNVKLIAALPPEAFSKPVSHPERGTMTFETIVETMGGHDLNHIGQIENIAAIR
jgi:DinB superfamily